MFTEMTAVMKAAVGLVVNRRMIRYDAATMTSSRIIRYAAKPFQGPRMPVRSRTGPI